MPPRHLHQPHHRYHTRPQEHWHHTHNLSHDATPRIRQRTHDKPPTSPILLHRANRPNPTRRLRAPTQHVNRRNKTIHPMLLKIIPLILLLLTLPDIYIYYMSIHRLTTRIWFRLIWFMPSLIIAVTAATIISSNQRFPATSRSQQLNHNKSSYIISTYIHIIIKYFTQ